MEKKKEEEGVFQVLSGGVLVGLGILLFFEMSKVHPIVISGLAFFIAGGGLMLEARAKYLNAKESKPVDMLFNGIILFIVGALFIFGFEWAKDNFTLAIKIFGIGITVAGIGLVYNGIKGRNVLFFGGCAFLLAGFSLLSGLTPLNPFTIIGIGSFFAGLALMINALRK